MASLVKALRPFATCDIGDALVKLKYPLGGYLDGISMWSPTLPGSSSAPNTRIIGQAVTIKMVPASDTTSPKSPVHFADANEAGKIMFISQPAGLASACFGGLMAMRTKVSGAEGVIIDGRFRDIQEIQELGLPLFAKSNSILGSNTFTRASEINVPIKFKDDLWVNPGDILVADQDGVVVVPERLVESVVEICAVRKEVDERTMEALKGGMGMAEALAKFRK